MALLKIPTRNPIRAHSSFHAEGISECVLDVQTVVCLALPTLPAMRSVGMIVDPITILNEKRAPRQTNGLFAILLGRLINAIILLKCF